MGLNGGFIEKTIEDELPARFISLLNLTTSFIIEILSIFFLDSFSILVVFQLPASFRELFATECIKSLASLACCCFYRENLLSSFIENFALLRMGLNDRFIEKTIEDNRGGAN